MARDAASGDLGVAVQSAYFTVGPVVPWAEAGVGVVATQSVVNIGYGPLGLELLRGGLAPDQVIASLQAGDAEPDGRQVAVLSADGRVAAITGARSIPCAGHRTGSGYSCQANLMERDTVWDAMAEAFETSVGQPLADRLVAALRAAEREGGDIRGRQSAALVVVSGQPTGRIWEDRRIDLRVEDHPDPVEELARLVRIKRAFATALAGDRIAALEIAPQMTQIRFLAGVAHAEAGDWDAAMPLLKSVVDAEPRFREALRRMASVGRVPADLAEQIETRL